MADNMLHGLGKYLRLCGADVVFLDNDDDHMQAVKVNYIWLVIIQRIFLTIL